MLLYFILQQLLMQKFVKKCVVHNFQQNYALHIHPACMPLHRSIHTTLICIWRIFWHDSTPAHPRKDITHNRTQTAEAMCNEQSALLTQCDATTLIIQGGRLGLRESRCTGLSSGPGGGGWLERGVGKQVRMDKNVRVYHVAAWK